MMGKYSEAARAKRRGLAEALIADVATAPANDNDHWRVELGDGVGAVHHEGHPTFSAKFTKTTQHEFEELSQDLMVNDAANGRVFYDFRWRRFEEPAGKALDDLMARMMKVVTARVGRR